MTNLSDKIISVFLEKEALVLKDSEISLSLVAQGIQCYIEEVRHRVRLLSPGLFQLSFNKDNSVTIHVDPTIDICGAFLSGRCHNAVKSCGKLHLCREFGFCTIRNCRFPHDFTFGENRKIVEQMKCEDINAQLIVNLIRLKKKSTHTASFSNTRKPTNYKQESVKKDDTNRQIDISFPSLNLAPQIDMEIIEMVLNVEDIRIEKKLNENENEFFRRGTVQLEREDDVDKLLASPVLTRDNIDIKFKRTNQIIDRSGFILKASINDKQNRLIEDRVRLYITLLVGNNVLYTINDLSTINEQVFHVQCNNEIDFDKVRQQYETKPQLQGRDISLVQTYECDAITMRYIDEKKIMKYDDVEYILRFIRKNIFTFQFTDDNYVEVEFINTDAYKDWMLTVEKTKTRYGITITPVVDSVDDNENNTASVQNIPFNIDTPHLTKIKLRAEWAMVAAHPIFQFEFKNYIHDELGGIIEINDDEVIYSGDFPRLPRCPTNESILANKTNNYMQKLKYQTYHDLKRYHVNILRENSNTIAFRRTQRNDYIVAGKPNDVHELRSKLFPKTNQRYQPNQTDSMTSRQMNDRSPPPPLLRQETTERSTNLSSTSSITPASIYAVTTSEQISMFSINTFEDRLQTHLQETFNVKTIIERNTIPDKVKGEKSRIIIKIMGQTNDVEGALNDLMNLFSSLRTRTFNDKTDGNWTKIEEATQVIQHHFNLIDLICTCQKVSSTVVYVNYFDLTNPQFGVDEQRIEDLINNQFSLATITYTPQSTSSKFTKEWTDLEDLIRKRDDYKKDICLYNETNAIYLFGLSKLVKDFRQTFEKLKNNHVPQSCKITLSEKQLKYLIHVAKNDLNKLEKQYKSDGCDLSLTRLRQQGDFLAPSDMHEKIKDSLEALTQIDEVKFEIKSSAFEALITKEPERLLSLVKSKCYLEKKVQTRQTHILVPKARVADLNEDLVQQSDGASASSATTVNIGNSTITIAIGDLTVQAVDVIVVCSTSDFLRKSVLSAAGLRVQAEYDTERSNNHQQCDTSNGTLPCKRILYLPWKADSSDLSTLKPSLSTFVAAAISYASKNKFKTIAFPSVGCGKFGFDPSIIAKHMIDETQMQLLTNQSKIDVSFILLPNQQNVYDEFTKYLNCIRTAPATASKALPTRKNDKQLKITYNEKIIEITLISSNNHHLIKCRQDILELSRSSSYTQRLTDKHDMIDWSQSTINQYYIDCLKEHVIPTLDFETLTIELVGPREAVLEAEKQFYELTTETFKEARNHAVSRGVIWSVEGTPGSDTWEQYSFKLNGSIEDAHRKKLPYVEFTNDKQEKCRVVFDQMEEHSGTDIRRRVQRKVVDSSLPDTWERSDQNCKQVTLQPSSKEYKDVLQKFNVTMNGQYTQIVKIERIQNERWYKQYTAHRDEYKRRYQQLDERFLFHGCLGNASTQIIQECFNRSFAGVNGTAYGWGVYFHSHAIYSHNYARPSGSGERTMFLARVLIGKTHQGNSTMKVPPAGYDTTTDGQHIFVIYHDAAAYADHLITYK